MIRFNLLNRRMELGIPRRELAEALQISSGHYRRIEQGVRNPSASLRLRIRRQLAEYSKDLFLLQEIFLDPELIRDSQR